MRPVEPVKRMFKLSPQEYVGVYKYHCGCPHSYFLIPGMWVSLINPRPLCADGYWGYGSTENRRDLADLLHQLLKLQRFYGLIAVR